MSVLWTIPMDGTFDQEGPIRWLRCMAERSKDSNRMKMDSYDLKSATDWWPLSVIHEVFKIFFGPTRHVWLMSRP